jgi:putative tryptophan/tyrosine transport system substrate-binding protein
MISRRSILASFPIAVVDRAFAQQRSRLPRVAILEWEPPAGADRLIPFRQSLQAEGYVDGQNIRLEQFFAEGRQERAEALADQIVREAFDVIVAFATPAAHAAKRATTRIPIVFGSADPLGTGLVSSLARPGGNLTGVSSMLSDIEGKRLALLQELLPNLDRVAFILSSVDPAACASRRKPCAAGGRIGVTVLPTAAASPEAVEDAVETALRAGAQALMIQPLFTLSNHSAQIVAEITRRRRIPAVATYATFARHGGLVSFGPALEFARRRAAVLVAKVLRGANPGDLPVEQPTEFVLAINMAAARELAIAVPALLLARADEVIE